MCGNVPLLFYPSTFSWYGNERLGLLGTFRIGMLKINGADELLETEGNFGVLHTAL